MIKNNKLAIDFYFLKYPSLVEGFFVGEICPTIIESKKERR